MLLVGDDEGDGNVLSTSFSCNRDDHNNAVLFTMVQDNESTELIETSRHEIIPIFFACGGAEVPTMVFTVIVYHCLFTSNSRNRIQEKEEVHCRR